MLSTIFWTQQELELLWSQRANQMNLAAIIQGEDGLECEVSMFLSSALILFLLQKYNLWQPGYTGFVLCFKESSYAAVGYYSSDTALGSYAKAWGKV